MLFKSSTNLTSALSAALHHQKGQRQVIFLAAAVTGLVLWKLHTGIHQASLADSSPAPAEISTADHRMAGMKWSYDELAHKLIVENADFAYAEAEDGFSGGLGRALQKVTKGIAAQNAGKRIVVNL
jgi:hypothetical protein